MSARSGHTVRLVQAIRASVPPAYEWDERELALFHIAERQAADIDALEAHIAEHGVRSERGRLSTIVSEVRQGRVALARILSGIDIPEAEPESMLHARRAAHVRWGDSPSRRREAS